MIELVNYNNKGNIPVICSTCEHLDYFDTYRCSANKDDIFDIIEKDNEVICKLNRYETRSVPEECKKVVKDKCPFWCLECKAKKYHLP